MTDAILDRIWTALERNEAFGSVKLSGLRERLREEIDAALVEASAVAADKPFEFELSDFRFVNYAAGKKALRFTLTWKFDHPEYGLLGQSTEGCLISRSHDGKWRVSMPLSKFAPHQSKILSTITVDLHDAIVSRLAQWKTSKGVSYLDYLVDKKELSELEDLLKPVPASELDPELPEEIAA